MDQGMALQYRQSASCQDAESGANEVMQQKLRTLVTKHMQAVRLAAFYRSRNKKLVQQMEEAIQKAQKLEALETARIEVAAAAHEEINAKKAEKQNLQHELEESRKLVQQQQNELQLLKMKIQVQSGAHGRGNVSCKGSRRAGDVDPQHQPYDPKMEDDKRETSAAECMRLRSTLRSKDRQLRTLQAEIGHLRGQYRRAQEQNEKQQHELLKLTQRLEVLRKSKAQFEAKAVRTAVALEEACEHLKRERKERNFLLYLIRTRALEGSNETEKNQLRHARDAQNCLEPQENPQTVNAPEQPEQNFTQLAYMQEMVLNNIFPYAEASDKEPPRIKFSSHSPEPPCSSTQAIETGTVASDDLCSIREYESHNESPSEKRSGCKIDVETSCFEGPENAARSLLGENDTNEQLAVGNLSKETLFAARIKAAEQPVQHEQMRHSIKTTSAAATVNLIKETMDTANMHGTTTPCSTDLADPADLPANADSADPQTEQLASRLSERDFWLGNAEDGTIPPQKYHVLPAPIMQKQPTARASAWSQEGTCSAARSIRSPTNCSAENTLYQKPLKEIEYDSPMQQITDDANKAYSGSSTGRWIYLEGDATNACPASRQSGTQCADSAACHTHTQLHHREQCAYVKKDEISVSDKIQDYRVTVNERQQACTACHSQAQIKSLFPQTVADGEGHSRQETQPLREHSPEHPHRLTSMPQTQNHEKKQVDTLFEQRTPGLCDGTGTGHCIVEARAREIFQRSLETGSDSSAIPSCAEVRGSDGNKGDVGTVTQPACRCTSATSQGLTKQLSCFPQGQNAGLLMEAPESWKVAGHPGTYSSSHAACAEPPVTQRIQQKMLMQQRQVYQRGLCGRTRHQAANICLAKHGRQAAELKKPKGLLSNSPSHGSPNPSLTRCCKDNAPAYAVSPKCTSKTQIIPQVKDTLVSPILSGDRRHGKRCEGAQCRKSISHSFLPIDLDGATKPKAERPEALPLAQSWSGGKTPLAYKEKTQQISCGSCSPGSSSSPDSSSRTRQLAHFSWSVPSLSNSCPELAKAFVPTVTRVKPTEGRNMKGSVNKSSAVPVKLRVSDKSKCDTSQKHMLEPLTRVRKQQFWHPLSPEDHSAQKGASTFCTGTASYTAGLKLDAALFDFQPSMSPLNIAARIIQRYWPRTCKQSRQKPETPAVVALNSIPAGTLQPQYKKPFQPDCYKCIPRGEAQSKHNGPGSQDITSQPKALTAPGPSHASTPSQHRSPEALSTPAAENKQIELRVVRNAQAVRPRDCLELGLKQSYNEDAANSLDHIFQLNIPVSENSDASGMPKSLTGNRMANGSPSYGGQWAALRLQRQADSRKGTSCIPDDSVNHIPEISDDGSITSDTEFAAFLQEADTQERSENGLQAHHQCSGEQEIAGCEAHNYDTEAVGTHGVETIRFSETAHTLEEVASQLESSQIEGELNHLSSTQPHLRTFPGFCFKDSGSVFKDTKESSCGSEEVRPSGLKNVKHVPIPLTSSCQNLSRDAFFNNGLSHAAACGRYGAVQWPQQRIKGTAGSSACSRASLRQNVVPGLFQQLMPQKKTTVGNPIHTPDTYNGAGLPNATSALQGTQKRRAPGQPPIPPKDLLAAAEHVKLQRRLMEDVQDFRRHVLMQPKEDDGTSAG